MCCSSPAPTTATAEGASSREKQGQVAAVLGTSCQHRKTLRHGPSSISPGKHREDGARQEGSSAARLLLPSLLPTRAPAPQPTPAW